MDSFIRGYKDVLIFEDAQRKLLKLQLTWGRLLAFVMHWITSRKETIDLMEGVYRSSNDEKYIPPDAIEEILPAARSELSSLLVDIKKAFGINVARLAMVTGASLAMPIFIAMLRRVEGAKSLAAIGTSGAMPIFKSLIKGADAAKGIAATGKSEAMIARSLLKGANAAKGVAATVTHSIVALGFILDVINIWQNAKKLNEKGQLEASKHLENVSEELKKDKQEIIKIYLDGKLPADN